MQHSKQNSPIPALGEGPEPMVLEQKCSAPADRNIPKPDKGIGFSLLQVDTVKGTVLLCSLCCDSNIQARKPGISSQIWSSLLRKMRACSSCLCPGFDLLRGRMTLVGHGNEEGWRAHGEQRESLFGDLLRTPVSTALYHPPVIHASRAINSPNLNN